VRNLENVEIDEENVVGGGNLLHLAEAMIECREVSVRRFGTPERDLEVMFNGRALCVNVVL